MEKNTNLVVNCESCLFATQHFCPALFIFWIEVNNVWIKILCVKEKDVAQFYH